MLFPIIHLVMDENSSTPAPLLTSREQKTMATGRHTPTLRTPPSLHGLPTPDQMLLPVEAEMYHQETTYRLSLRCACETAHCQGQGPAAQKCHLEG